MKFCPISLEPIEDDATFSKAGLRSLHPRLIQLRPLDLTHEEQLRQARLRADKMSIQGVQPKLSARLRVSQSRFEVVDRGGTFLLKPNPPQFEEVPANEALTMTMAAMANIRVPPHGLLPTIDGGWIYVVRRFDRVGRNQKNHVEDFAQLSGETRSTKYDSSLERVAQLVETHCSFPALQKPELARRLLFCFLTGNEDMHLKNFSVWMNKDRMVSLSPAYDLLNTSLVLEQPAEESALPLDGKKKNLTKKLWLQYFCRDRLGLRPAIINGMCDELRGAIAPWRTLIARSQLSTPKKQAYEALLLERAARFGWA